MMGAPGLSHNHNSAPVNNQFGLGAAGFGAP